MEEDIYVYKIMVDNGGAPCVHRSLLSLCICKPRLRVSAKKDDWIIAIGGKTAPSDIRGQLIYIAQVTEVMKDGRYYKESPYKNRPDAIYEWNNEVKRFNWKLGSKFHEDGHDLIHDIGDHGSYDRAVCLTSSNFWYFGNADKPSIEDIRDIYEGLPRDFIKNHDPDVYGRLYSYIQKISKTFEMGKLGDPNHSDTKKKCNTGEDSDDQLLQSCSS